MTRRRFFRAVQYLPAEKIAEFKAMTALDRLRWLEAANDLLYRAYKRSGRPEPFDPRRWPFLATSPKS